MKRIRLTNKNRFALVNNRDYRTLSQWSRCAVTNRKPGKKYAFQYYAARTQKKGGKIKRIYMHRVIMKVQRGQLVDHKNRNTLDNRRRNLRLCTTQQNGQNARPHVKWGRSSHHIKYKGVIKSRTGKWTAQVVVNKKRVFFGCAHTTPRAAALAYDKGARKLFGTFALTNKKLGLL